MLGWGALHEKSTMTDILQEVQLPIISNAECKQKYLNLHDERYTDSNTNQFGDKVICAGFTEGGKDSCNGDSGGPLMLPEHRNTTIPFQYFQIGIVSSGIVLLVSFH